MTEKYTVTGLMSGSSLDGVDLACCELVKEGQAWSYSILAAETLPYPAPLKLILENASRWNMEMIRDLDSELGRYYAGLLNAFHRRHHLNPDLIASHGHTILHEPLRGITFQAGNGEIMAGKTGITVVSDFRSQDVAQGGQGAPLVPVGDRLLFGSFDGCLNLGGFANISYENREEQRIAYDICPANMALNHLAGMAGLPFDRDGRLAKKGCVINPLLTMLNQLEYYALTPPKSLGREWFLEHFLPLIEVTDQPISHLMATVTEHIAIQIGSAIGRAGLRSVLVTGGGALNQYLVERLHNHTGSGIEIPPAPVINYKEAVIFALLGVLKIRGEINCLSSVTGGATDLSAGFIHTI